MKFVLKSQKEGGAGANYFGESVAIRLGEMSQTERATYVLMERMWPMVHQVLYRKCSKFLQNYLKSVKY